MAGNAQFRRFQPGSGKPEGSVSGKINGNYILDSLAVKGLLSTIN
jgi:hypothetical protein